MAPLPTAPRSSDTYYRRAVSNSGLSMEAIIGLVTGCISLFSLLLAIGFLIYRRKRFVVTSPVYHSVREQPPDAQCHVTSPPGPGITISQRRSILEVPTASDRPSEPDPSSVPRVENEKPVVVDEKRILGLDDASYLSRLPAQQGELM
jgi:hypothetical protein